MFEDLFIDARGDILPLNPLVVVKGSLQQLFLLDVGCYILQQL